MSSSFNSDKMLKYCQIINIGIILYLTQVLTENTKSKLIQKLKRNEFDLPEDASNDEFLNEEDLDNKKYISPDFGKSSEKLKSDTITDVLSQQFLHKDIHQKGQSDSLLSIYLMIMKYLQFMLQNSNSTAPFTFSKLGPLSTKESTMKNFSGKKLRNKSKLKTNRGSNKINFAKKTTQHANPKKFYQWGINQ